ncbi:hypothetical protein BHE74_00051830 [Ensete ventricosum]|nr:hypothetical protein BHE74_00051830 [Ensete ventricosum]
MRSFVCAGSPPWSNSLKGSESSLGTRKEITGKKTRGLTAIMPEATVLCGS